MLEESKKYYKEATFAGGCFWCMEPPFDGLPGVLSVTAGYTGGRIANPTYEEVCTGTTGHAEAVSIVYDLKQISYPELLDIFWRNIDPTSKDRQFADRGSQYRTAIFYHDEEQRLQAIASKRELENTGKFDAPIVTEIVPAGSFYKAEEYHQKYYRKNAYGYQQYKVGSGRSGYIEQMWGLVKKS